MWLLIVVCAAVIGATTMLAVLPSVERSRAPGTADEAKHAPDASSCARLLSPEMGLRRKLQHVSSGLLILFLYLRGGVTPMQAAGCLLVCAAGLFCIHLVRKRVALVQRAYLALFSSLMRSHERAGAAPGAFYVLLGCGLSVLLFAPPPPPPPTAQPDCGIDASSTAWSLAAATGRVDIPALAILSLSIGDPLASFLGTWLGKRDRFRAFGGKSILAAAVSALVCTVAGFAMLYAMSADDACAAGSDPVLPWVSLPCAEQSAAVSTQRWLWAGVGAVSAALFELWSPSLFGLLPPVDDNLRIPLLTSVVLRACHWAGLLAIPLIVAKQCQI